MNNKEKITLLIAAIFSLTGSFSSYFVYQMHDEVRELKVSLKEYQRVQHAEYKEMKEDFEYVLKNYPSQDDHDKDILRVEKHIADIRLYARKED
jgi:hypothetical protein